MSDYKSSYIELIATRIARAAGLAAGQGFNAEIKGSALNISNKHSTAALLFRSDHIVLEQIGVDSTERCYGSAMLDLVIAVANQAELEIKLIAEAPLRPNKVDLSQLELQAWYRRRKFVDADHLFMSRLPDSVPLEHPVVNA
jgi:hypothetical protein